MDHGRTKGLVSALVMLGASILVAGCGKSDAAPAGGSTAATTAAGATAAGPVPTTNLTPAKLQQNAAALMGKKVQGEGLMYGYESGMLNGKMSYNAFIADDDKKTNSFKCTLSGETKIAKGSMVSFTGIWHGGHWVDECQITKK